MCARCNSLVGSDTTPSAIVKVKVRFASRPREKDKVSFREIVKRGPPPGLLAFDGDVARMMSMMSSMMADRYVHTSRQVAPEARDARVLRHVEGGQRGTLSAARITAGRDAVAPPM